MTIMNKKCFQIEVFLCPIAPEFSVKYLVLFNTILSIDTSEVKLKSVCNTLN